MFNGIWNALSVYKLLFTVLAGLSIILGAVYTLNMIQKIFFGNTNTITESARDIYTVERMALIAVVLVILVFGIYPQPLLNMTEGFVTEFMKSLNVANGL